MRRADNLTTFLVPIVLKSGILNLLEPSGPVQACNGIACYPFYPFMKRLKKTDKTTDQIPILDVQINEFTPRAGSNTSSAYLLDLLLAFYFIFVTLRLRKLKLCLR